MTSDDDFQKSVMVRSQAQADEAIRRGNTLADAVEAWLKDNAEDWPPSRPLAEAVAAYRSPKVEP